MSQEEKRVLFKNGNVEQVKRFLKDNPTWDVNEELDGYGCAPLHLACIYGHHEVVSVLVAHPQINVNQKDREGYTPFNDGCSTGNVEVVKVLLRDPRVDINMPEDGGRTPLWIASCWGYVEVIRWMIASGREINLDLKGERFGKEYTAIEVARENDKTEVVLLLEGFIASPARTRHEIRIELGVKEALVADNFAMVIFLSDGLLRTTPPAPNEEENSAGNNARKYFSIQLRFPMEIQNIVAYRSNGSAKERILTKDSEGAFRSLAHRFGNAHLN